MAILEDYYRILQVHYLAEPEVIESAYKRLAKKYHPDVNKMAGSEVRMKKINEAYETLSDGTKRRAYDAQRSFKPETPRPAYPNAASYQAASQRSGAEPKAGPQQEADIECPAAAKEVLTTYFACLKTRDFLAAYALITSLDKSNITQDDFVKWQAGVSRIYSLQEYSYKAVKLESNHRLNGRSFTQVVEFSVKTVEHNTVMGRLEKDTINKKVVLEDNAWRIYVGYEDIKPYIARFEELSGLLAAKSVINDMVEHYSYKDSGTGLYNKKGFAEAAQREILRYERYGNAFSVMLLEVELGKEALRPKNQDLQRHAAAWAGKLLSGSFRKLDILGRWGETGFIILLPETTLTSGVKAARKLTGVFAAEPLAYNGKAYPVKLNIGVEEFRGSLEDTIRNLGDYIAVAVKSKGNSIVYKSGIIH
jgi:diguanylate cyclase (GGDEF)-like protein